MKKIIEGPNSKVNEHWIVVLVKFGREFLILKKIEDNKYKLL